MTDIAVRNRSLKKLLESTYGRGNVRIRASRGTGYGWVHVYITTPLAFDDRPYAWQDEYSRVHKLVRDGEIEMYHFSADDNSGGRLPCMNISFDRPNEAAAA